MTTDEIFDRIVALRWTAQKFGMKTDRSQQVLLKSLDPEQLAEVSVRLKEFEEPTSALHGVKGGAK